MSDMCPKNDSEQEDAVSLPYRALVGKCMYLSTCTHPDISYAVCELAHFMSNYGQKHYNAAKHLLHYLKGTMSRGIIYRNHSDSLPISTCTATLTGL
jgi:hypothetical protein